MATSFELDISRFVEKANGNINLVVRKVSFDIFRRVVMKSPIDTGRFKSNWQVAIGFAPGGTLNTFDKSGSATLARIQAATLAMEAGQVIYMVNNLAYARPLEYGWSKQAPRGMVRLTLQEFPHVVRTVATGLNR